MENTLFIVRCDGNFAHKICAFVLANWMKSDVFLVVLHNTQWMSALSVRFAYIISYCGACVLSSQCLIKRQYNGFDIAADTITQAWYRDLWYNFAHVFVALNVSLLFACSFVTVVCNCSCHTFIAPSPARLSQSLLSLSASRKLFTISNKRVPFSKIIVTNSRAASKVSRWRRNFSTNYKQIVILSSFFLHSLFYRRFWFFLFFFFPSNSNDFFCAGSSH